MCQLGVIMGHWGSLGFGGGYWGSLGIIGAQRGSLGLNVYTPWDGSDLLLS